MADDTKTAEQSAASADDRLRRVLSQHGAALGRLASSWTRTPSERDDLLQDIALSLLTALPLFRGDCPERAFVLRIAHNRALTHAHKRRSSETDGDAALEQVPTPAPSPLEVAEHDERRRRLQAAIQRLPDDKRVVIVLALEGLSHQEIAAVVGGNTNAIAVRLHRARAALTTLLTEPTNPESP